MTNAVIWGVGEPEALDLLAFGPHPDDVELFCGGLLIASARRGHRVGVVDLTRGEMASNGTAAQRAEEARAAAQVMGLHWRENLGLPDAGLAPGDERAALAIVGALRRLRPEVVLAPWRQARHPDHSAASALVTRAAFLAGLRRVLPDAGPPWRPTQLLYYPMRYRLEPSFLVDTSDVIEDKRRAIACYSSQVQQPADAAPTLIGAADALEALEARERAWGALIGARYAEAYRTTSALAIDDPIDHLRRNQHGPPHLFEEHG